MRNDKFLNRMLRLCGTFAFGLGLCVAAAAQTTAFSYQGKLTDSGALANANYDLQFKLFDTVTPGTGIQQGTTQVVNPVQASAGIFTVTLDFGLVVFNGADRYLEVGVRPSGSAGAYTILSPRQQITSSPYALQTLSASQLGGLPASRYVHSEANGNVGIGTASPAHHLDINGGPGWTANGWVGAVALSNASAIGWHPEASGSAFGIGQTTGGLFVFNTQSPPGNTSAQANYLFTIADTGNVGVGVTNPTSKVEIAAQDGLKVSGFQPFLTLKDTNSGGSAYLQGVQGGATLLTDTKAFLVLQNVTGNVGLGVPAPVHRLDINGGPGWTSNGWLGAIAMSNASALGWRPDAAGRSFGIGQSTGGLYIFNTASAPGVASGPASSVLQISDFGHVVQPIGYNGLPKAMLAVGNATITACYNGVTGSATSGCGFTITHIANGIFRINFGFNVNGRFVSVANIYDSNGSFSQWHNEGINFRQYSATEIEVFTFLANGSNDTFDSDFHLLLF